MIVHGEYAALAESFALKPESHQQREWSEIGVLNPAELIEDTVMDLIRSSTTDGTTYTHASPDVSYDTGVAFERAGVVGLMTNTVPTPPAPPPSSPSPDSGGSDTGSASSDVPAVINDIRMLQLKMSAQVGSGAAINNHSARAERAEQADAELDVSLYLAGPGVRKDSDIVKRLGSKVAYGVFRWTAAASQVMFTSIVPRGALRAHKHWVQLGLA